METVTTTPELLHSTTESNSHLFDDWLDPIETGIRDRVHELIEEMIRSELDAVLSRPRYGRRAGPAEDSDVTAVVTGHRHWSRVRKDTVRRVWRELKGDWEAWNSRSLADEPIVRLILDGTWIVGASSAVPDSVPV